MNQNYVPGHLHHLLQQCHRRETVDTWWVDCWNVSLRANTSSSDERPRQQKAREYKKLLGAARGTPVSELGRMYVCMYVSRYDVCMYVDMYVCMCVCIFSISDFSESEWQDEIKLLGKVKDHQVTLHIQVLVKAVDPVCRKNCKTCYIYVFYGWLGVRFSQLHPLGINL